LNDDEDALSDHDYAALLLEAEETSVPCQSAVPADVLESALEHLDADNG
jgi:hypothetical protein